MSSKFCSIQFTLWQYLTALWLLSNYLIVHSSPQPSTNEDLCSMQEEDLAEVRRSKTGS